MFPDQNQDQTQPQVAPAQPFPGQQPAVSPVAPIQPDPAMVPPVPPMVETASTPAGSPEPSSLGGPLPPASSPLGMPVSPPQPVSSMEAPQPTVNPLVPGSAPVAPVAPQPPVSPVPAPAGPVVQPPLDSSQPGYVPPAVPVQPMAPMTGSVGGGGNKFAKLRIIIALVVGLGVLGGAAFFAKSALLGGGISIKNLVQDQANDVSFKRPKNWTKTSAADTKSSETVFTEGGKAEKDSNAVLIVSSMSLGVDYDSLSTSQKQQFIDTLKKSDSEDDGGTSTDDRCQSGEKATINDFRQSNYSVAISSEMTCDKLKIGDKVTKAKGKAVLGIKGDKVYLISIASSDNIWNHSQKAFDEIFNTFKPAN